MNHSNKLIIGLLLANLAATFYFGSHKTSVPSEQKPYEKASQHQLPALIDQRVKSHILDTFITHFNAQDYDALYHMFGPIAQAQITREQLDSEFAKLAKFFHRVESGNFNFAEFSGQQGSTTVYVLNYAVSLSEQSAFGQAGNLKVTIAIDGNDYQIYGIRLNAGT